MKIVVASGFRRRPKDARYSPKTSCGFRKPFSSKDLLAVLRPLFPQA
jgi:hypothetical protein